MDLKRQGRYACRTLSYAASSFEQVEADLGMRMEVLPVREQDANGERWESVGDVYDAAARFWLRLRAAMLEAEATATRHVQAMKHAARVGAQPTMFVGCVAESGQEQLVTSVV